ncbi:hypothetical protein VTP01DRAFT_7803 [Rhizomucor pusillus]|uniref:uncharacterized protein n=1 Tax=Rhizomucor pusillus TaxID=4840 RepID=UPI0037449905
MATLARHHFTMTQAQFADWRKIHWVAMLFPQLNSFFSSFPHSSTCPSIIFYVHQMASPVSSREMFLSRVPQFIFVSPFFLSCASDGLAGVVPRDVPLTDGLTNCCVSDGLAGVVPRDVPLTGTTVPT